MPLHSAASSNQIYLQQMPKVCLYTKCTEVGSMSHIQESATANNHPLGSTCEQLGQFSHPLFYPSSLRDPILTLTSFCSGLKTHLFTRDCLGCKNSRIINFLIHTYIHTNWYTPWWVCACRVGCIAVQRGWQLTMPGRWTRQSCKCW